VKWGRLNFLSFAGARERAGRGLLHKEIGFAPEMTRAGRGHAAHSFLSAVKRRFARGHGCKNYPVHAAFMASGGAVGVHHRVPLAIWAG
jgi:hypothetical protein